MFLPLPEGEVGVRGNRTLAVLAASALVSARDERRKEHMALSHSSFQTSGLAGCAATFLFASGRFTSER